MACYGPLFSENQFSPADEAVARRLDKTQPQVMLRFDFSPLGYKDMMSGGCRVANSTLSSILSCLLPTDLLNHLQNCKSSKENAPKNLLKMYARLVNLLNRLTLSKLCYSSNLLAM